MVFLVNFSSLNFILGLAIIVIFIIYLLLYFFKPKTMPLMKGKVKVPEKEELTKAITRIKAGGETADRFTRQLLSLTKDYNFILVKTKGTINVLPMLSYFFKELSKQFILIPFLGPTPFSEVKDFVKTKAKGEDKIGLRVTKLADSEKDKRILYVSPQDDFQIVNFINTLAKRNQEMIVLGDFLDEMYDTLDEKGFHSFVSQLQNALIGKKLKLILFLKEELYPKIYIDLLQRYVNAKIEVESKGLAKTQIITFFDENKGLKKRLHKSF
jgi:hypothetical protein